MFLHIITILNVHEYKRNGFMHMYAEVDDNILFYITPRFFYICEIGYHILYD